MFHGVYHHLEQKDLMPQIIFANDYLEGLIGIGLEKNGREINNAAEVFWNDYRIININKDYDVVAAIGDQ